MMERPRCDWQGIKPSAVHATHPEMRPDRSTVRLLSLGRPERGSFSRCRGAVALIVPFAALLQRPSRDQTTTSQQQIVMILVSNT